MNLNNLPMGKVKGIDVSSYQGNVDWTKVANQGINFAILRSALRSGNLDTFFETNYSGAKSAGLEVDVYQFSYALNTESAVNDARNLIAKLNGKQVGIWLDLEWTDQGKLGKDKVTEIAIAYINECKRLGYQCNIYSNTVWYQNYYHADKLKDLGCKFWIAKYGVNDGVYDESRKPNIGEFIWQYTSRGKVDGISGNVDLNMMYVDEGDKMANTVDKVLEIAEAEVGYLEKKSNSQLYDKTANAGSANYTKYGKEMHDVYPSVMDFPAAWCDAFVDWCFYKAYGVTTAKSLIGGNFDDYTVASAQMYKNKNAWYTSNPKIGDQIFFKNSTRICHTGLVYKVDNTYVYTIEGNTSSGDNTVIANGGGVFKKKYKLNYSSIAGYGRPKYDINKKYTVGWNQDSTGWWYSPDGTTYYKSQFVDIDGYRYYFNDNGYAVKDWQKIDNKWYYFETTKGDFECALYVSDSNGVQAPGFFGKTGTVYNCSTLNVRSKNNASSNIITSISSGTKVTILKESDGWYYVKLSDGTKGWVSGKYIQIK